MIVDRRCSERDRRQGHRVPAVFAVMNTCGRVHLGQAEDIGPGGISLRWPKDVRFSPNAPLALQFALPGCDQRISARGTITHDRRAGRFRRTGVRFTGLEPQVHALIARYCDSRR